MAAPRQFIRFLTGLMMTAGSLSSAYAQAEAELFGTDMMAPPIQRLIDLPTAGTLPKGTAAMSLRVYTAGGLLGGLYGGISDRLMVGISFGGSNILGTGRINWNPRPEVLCKFLLLSESIILPAVSFGFESQGYGPYDDDLDRYQVKSRGFYGVLSRSLALAGTLGLHAGVSYGIENKDNNGKFNVFLGADKSINEYLMVMFEYDFADNDDLSLPGLGRDRGYLNLGARVTFGGFGIEFDLRNLLDNRTGSVSPSRELKILYTEGFYF